MGFIAVVAVFVALVVASAAITHFRRARRLRFIESYAFPDALTSKLQERHPDLTPLQLERAVAALREWFVACHHAQGEMIAMPSRVADDAWHEFILMTRLYHEFCDKAFGRYLHHTPDAVSDRPIRPAIPKTLELLERKVGTPVLAGVGALPLLFTVDTELGVERGRFWTRESITWEGESESTESCLGGASHKTGADDGCGGCSGCGGCGSCA
jgi:hypothetical protein